MIIIKIEDETEVMTRTTRKCGTGGHVSIPKRYVGKEVLIIVK